MGWPKATSRIIVGVVVIFAWREFMKPTLLKVLPPIFRIVESLGLNLPRRFFKQASEYKEVPKDLKDDNVIPYVSEIPSLLTSIRHPGRSRSVSMGPQSQADAYEVLAYREKRRRESISETASGTSGLVQERNTKGTPSEYFSLQTPTTTARMPLSGQLPTPAMSDVDLYRQMMGAETALYSPLTPAAGSSMEGTPARRPSDDTREYEREEREMFAKLEKPRVRYDVEVITKLIVYAGIAWIAVEAQGSLLVTKQVIRIARGCPSRQDRNVNILSQVDVRFKTTGAAIHIGMAGRSNAHAVRHIGAYEAADLGDVGAALLARFQCASVGVASRAVRCDLSRKPESKGDET
ncbi:MAG: hypothetical protein Q9195_005277 [Heterodermia aff. obscurata]